MKKITVIVEKENQPITGGQKYDAYFINELKNIDNTVNVISDVEFRKYSFYPFFLYNIRYIKFWKILSSSDIIIINSRLYPRLFFFILFFKNFIKKNIKIFAFHHHYNFMVHEGFKRKIHKYFEITFLKKMYCLIIPSKYVLEITKELLPSMRTKLIELAFENKSLKIPELNKNELVFIGKIEHRKGLHLLLESLKHLNLEFKINLVGYYNPQDPYYIKLKQTIDSLGLQKRIIFHGRLDDTKMAKILSRSSVFVFPSLHEGYGMVMREAMAYGLPIVAFNNSSIPFVVKDNFNGLIAENKNVSDFAKKISRLLTDKEYLKTLSNNSLKTYELSRKHDELDYDIKQFYHNILS